MGLVLDLIHKQIANGKKALALLLDPDEFGKNELSNLFSKEHQHVSYYLVGGSLIKDGDNDTLIDEVKKHTDKPIIIFPGNFQHLSSNADAVLFLSLVSGRNAEFLIGQQVVAAPLLKRSGLEVLSTAYMLIDGGKSTTVSYMSNTAPIPSDKPDIAACTALAAKYLGFQLVYMDAGSGAQKPITQEMIRAVKRETNLPLIVGGGIKDYKNMEMAFDSGADIVVVGNALQEETNTLSNLKSESAFKG